MKIKILVIVIMELMISSVFIGAGSEQDFYHKIETVSPLVKEDLTKYVNPFIGTDAYSPDGVIEPLGCGNTYPGAVIPFGMVQLSPDTSNNINDLHSSYYYNSSKIEGFSHIHGSGFGFKALGNILITATTGRIETTEEKYGSNFSHESEVASPGYYAVTLDDYNIRTELTTTERCGLHRYTFPESEKSNIIIDVGHHLIEDAPCRGAHIEILEDKNQVIGYVKDSTGYTTVREKLFERYTVYFVAELNKNLSSYGTWNDSKEKTLSNEESGIDVGAWITYSTSEGESIEVKVGLSFVSVEQARKNLEHEIPQWDFENIKDAAKQAWNEELSRIEIGGGTEDQMIKFYTALYHCLLAPHTFTDSDGTYLGMDDKIHIAEGYKHYTCFSFWDTFRTEHPLLTLVYPERQTDMMKSLIDKYRQGGWLPRSELLNNYLNHMIGDPATPVIVDTYMKGIKGFDINKAYEGMRKSAMRTPPFWHPYTARTGLGFYLQLGYVPFSQLASLAWLVFSRVPLIKRFPVNMISKYRGLLEGVSCTLEYAYEDWCLAQIAKSLGKDKDYEEYMKRSYYYQNVWDPSTQLMRPKNLFGFWKKPFNPKEEAGYIEGNAWTYTWFVPHDVQGLIQLMGGKEKFIEKLDYFMEEFGYPTGHERPEHYWHGNEPDIHVSYLYNYASAPWKTQEIVRKIMNELYGTGPKGLPGHDDRGTMSAWYVFSALGFYPVCPGNTTYQIGSPIFNKVTIHLNDQYYNKGEFIIRADNVSEENKYIQSATLNCKPLNRPWIKHSEIVNGGMLIFEMGDTPSDWGS